MGLVGTLDFLEGRKVTEGGGPLHGFFCVYMENFDLEKEEVKKEGQIGT